MSYWRSISIILAAAAIGSFLSGLSLEWMLAPMAQNDTSAYYLTIIKYGVVTIILLVAAIFCALMDIGDRLREKTKA